MRACLLLCVERLARDFIGGLSSTERVMTLSLVVTYCLRSIITMANEVSSIMSANTPASDNIIFIISSSIYSFGLKTSSKVLLANS